MPEDAAPGFDLTDIFNFIPDNGAIPNLPVTFLDNLVSLFVQFVDGGGLDGIPADLQGSSLDELLGRLFDMTDGNGPNIDPDSLPRSLDDLIGLLFDMTDGHGSGDDRNDLNTALDELLARSFDGTDSGGPVDDRQGNDLSIEDLIRTGLNDHPGAFANDPGSAAQQAPAPEWDGNVPPDLTDGFDFLL